MHFINLQTKASKQSVFCTFLASSVLSVILFYVIGVHAADSISEQEPTLDTLFEDMPFLEIEDHSSQETGTEAVLLVVDSSTDKQGNAISRLFKKIGDSLSGSNLVKAEKAPENKLLQTGSDKKVAAKTQSDDKQQPQTVDDVAVSTSSESFDNVLNGYKMGFDARVENADGFRVLDEAPASETVEKLGVGDDWQDLSAVLGAPTAWSSDDRLNTFGIDNTKTLNLHASSHFSLDLQNRKWSSQNGRHNSQSFDNMHYVRYGQDINDITQTSPELMLNWNVGPGGKIGAYRLSAIGRKLFSQGYYQGQYVADETYGWGVNLAGDWRFGGLNAGLSLAVGEGVDSVLLPINSDDLYVYNGDIHKTQVVSFVPSIQYHFANKSQVKFSVGRYQNESESMQQIDTLDTVHVGYSWNTKNDSTLGIEFVEQQIDGEVGDLKSDQQIRFGIRRHF